MMMTPGSAAAGSGAGAGYAPQLSGSGAGAHMQAQLERMVQSGRNTPVQRASPSPAPNVGMSGQSGGGAAQQMGRSVSMMDMNQWARMSAQQSFMQQPQATPLSQWGMGVNVPGAGGVQESPGCVYRSIRPVLLIPNGMLADLILQELPEMQRQQS